MGACGAGLLVNFETTEHTKYTEKAPKAQDDEGWCYEDAQEEGAYGHKNALHFL
jgi:hypothetical protein